jgi:signal transduction histidine kinase/ActR/RegA family two-component response regulator
MLMPKDVEESRLKVLQEYAILDTQDENIFDDLTYLASHICQTPMALITLLDRDRQWFKSKLGFEIKETPRDIAFCNKTIEHAEVFVIRDALQDVRFAENPLVTSRPHIRFYAGARITSPEGYTLGSLCVLDTKPKELTEEQRAALQALARQVMNLLESRRAKLEATRLQALLQNEQQHLLDKEINARKLAEDANHLKDDFLATLSHELRTPLNSILGWAKIIHTQNLDNGMKARAVDTIIRSAQSQAKLIEDLLDISRIISGKMRLDARPVQLPSLIEDVLETVRLAAEVKAIRLESIIDPKAAVVTGDSERIQQIIWNLLSNAIKFTPKEGRIQIRLERIKSHLELSISDTGQGIDPEFLPQVFDRFRQGDSSSTRKTTGLGLGLAIVRHLVELHGGSIYADSRGEGQGATFTVNFPLRITGNRESQREHPAVSIEMPLELIPELDGVRVLVVDDDEDSRLLVEAFLSRSGAEVSLCANAREALEAIQTVRPHVLISDLGMPDEDGYDLIRKVRALAAKQGGQTPAIMMTAYTRPKDRIKALSIGYQTFISKPLEPAELIAAVGSLARLGKNFM